jgi:hypothetical protein
MEMSALRDRTRLSEAKSGWDVRGSGNRDFPVQISGANI